MLILFTLNKIKKIYFASDFHLGVPDYLSSRERESRIVRWLDQVKEDAHEIYLLGDVFDFWFEYRTVVPKGFVRLLGKLAELSDRGIPIHFFPGNHDMWIFDYFEKELGIRIHNGPFRVEYNGKKFFLEHGDGLGPGDYGYKLLKKVFSNKICKWLFARIHPNFGIGLANLWSRKSRISSSRDEEFLGEANEWLIQFSKKTLEKEQIDYFIFGHRHLPLHIEIAPGSYYVNLGEWINYNSYAVFDGEKLELCYFEQDSNKKLAR